VGLLLRRKAKTIVVSAPPSVLEQWKGDLEDRLRYTPSDCFETFPFPDGWQSHPALESAGAEYYELRAGLMVRNHEGLNRTYNRFHHPDEADPAILRLRELHAAMDRAVLDAYGWPDDVRDEVLAWSWRHDLRRGRFALLATTAVVVPLEVGFGYGGWGVKSLKTQIRG